MADKKATTSKKKKSTAKPPTLAERITDTSTGGMKDIKFVPKKGTGKK